MGAGVTEEQRREHVGARRGRPGYDLANAVGSESYRRSHSMGFFLVLLGRHLSGI